MEHSDDGMRSSIARDARARNRLKPEQRMLGAAQDIRP